MAGKWKLEIEFRDMFFLVWHAQKGGIVLLPRGRHAAVLWVDDPKFSYGLYRAQVNIRDSNGSILWGTPSTRQNRNNLLSANHVFQKIAIRRELIEERSVPEDLNARVVLGRGVFTDLEARNRHARFAWGFTGVGTIPPHKLTDRLRYEVEMPAGDAELLITHSDGARDEIRIKEGDHKLVIWNRDFRQVDDEEGQIAPGSHELEEYQLLHALIGKDREKIHPIGNYPDGILVSGRTGPIGNDEPICGGEEGEPDPPPNDPPAP